MLFYTFQVFYNECVWVFLVCFFNPSIGNFRNIPVSVSFRLFAQRVSLGKRSFNVPK